MANHYYRKDIDGLRAVAVCSVLFYHLGFSSLPGGFVGVDIFFVISGYLITQIILRQRQNDSFSFVDFYVRRVKRLMPALFCTLFFSSIVACLVLFPSDLKGYFLSATSASFAVANFYFWREHGGYFGGNSADVPLLHTWSLGVEEQFYFVWPAMVVLAFMFKRKYVLHLLMGASFFGALIFSEYVVQTTFGAAYYLMPTRFFELAGGAWIGLLAFDNKASSNKIVNNFLAIAGLALIASGIFLLSKADDFPGFNALLPALGAMALIQAGDKSIVAKLLSVSPATFLGKISYSLYLVHWPLIVFTTYVGIELSTPVALSLLASALVLGYLQWRFVENHFRFAKDSSQLQTCLKFFLAPALVTTLVTVIVVLNQGLPNRFSTEVQVMDLAINTKPSEYRGTCHSSRQQYASLPSDECYFGVKDPGAKDQGHKTALLIGDSHANHLTGFIETHAKAANTKVRDYTMDSCMPLLIDIPESEQSYNESVCFKRNAQIFEHLAQSSYDSVVIAGLWPKNEYHYSREQLLSAFSELISAISAQGANPVLMLDVPGTFKASPNCPIKLAAFGHITSCDAPIAKAQKNAKLMTEIAAQLQLQFPSLSIKDPMQALCQQGQCVTALEGLPIYLDASHLNHTGSQKLGQAYLAQQGNIFGD